MQFRSKVESAFYKISGSPEISTTIPYIVVENFPLMGLLTALRFLEWASENPEGVISLPTGKTPEYFIKWTTHLLENTCYLASPNMDERPEGTTVNLIVVHCISLPPGEYGGYWIDDLFTNCLDPGAHEFFPSICGLRVSAHVLIRRDGSVTQYVPFDMRAWHAGESCFQGRSACNDFSIGIELEGTDEQLYEDAQYRRLAGLISLLMDCYPRITPERIVGHCDIAPGRKTDPGPVFDWSRLKRLLGSGPS